MEKRRNCSLGAISPLFHNIFYFLSDFHVLEGTRFSLRDKQLFKISEFEITRVNCILTAPLNSMMHHKTVHYKMVSDLRWFKGVPKKCCIQTKMCRLYRKMTIYGHFSI